MILSKVILQAGLHRLLFHMPADMNYVSRFMTGHGPKRQEDSTSDSCSNLETQTGHDTHPEHTGKLQVNWFNICTNCLMHLDSQMQLVG